MFYPVVSINSPRSLYQQHCWPRPLTSGSRLLQRPASLIDREGVEVVEAGVSVDNLRGLSLADVGEAETDPEAGARVYHQLSLVRVRGFVSSPLPPGLSVVTRHPMTQDDVV